MKLEPIAFDANDPFPIWPSENDYPREKLHSAQVDAWLGLRIDAVETGLVAREGEDRSRWIGLAPQTLLTPYSEFRRMLRDAAPATPEFTAVDLGAGYGRLGFVLARHFPSARFVGYECVPERANEGNRALAQSGIPASQAVLITADLADPGFRPLAADVYWIYDFGPAAAIRKALEDIRTISQHQPLTVVGRGRSSRDEIERGQPWLSQVVPPEHRGNYSIYRTRPQRREEAI